MTTWTLIRRSLVFHWRSHLGVLLGAAIGSAALVGALVVGDSVRGSLEERAAARLGSVEIAMHSGDRYFSADLGKRLPLVRPGPNHGMGVASNPDDRLIWGQSGESRVGTVLLQGTAARQDGAARARQVQVLGVVPEFWRMSLREQRRAEQAERMLHRRLWSTPSAGPGGPWSEEFESGFREALQFSLRPSPGGVRLNRPLAEQLSAKPGDTVILRFPKPTALSADVTLSSGQDAGVAMKLVVEDIVDDDRFGAFGLRSGRRPAWNAFVNLGELWQATGLTNRANLMLLPAGKLARPPSAWRETVRRALRGAAGWLPRPLFDMAHRWTFVGQRPTPAETALTMDYLERELENAWDLDDAELAVREIDEPENRTGGEFMGSMVEVASPRVFLEAAVVQAARVPRNRTLSSHRRFATDSAADVAEASYVTNGVPVLTYLANALRAGDRLVPYSFVTAAGAPWTPADLRDDEIVVNEWLAAELGIKPGDGLELTYYDPEAGARLLERTNRFSVRSVVAVRGVHADRTLMPELPGLAKAESASEWDTGFPLVHRIREVDDVYWKTHRGTPKAFVSEPAGRAMWSNRFGNATAVRYRVPAGGFASGFKRIVEANLLANLEPSRTGLNFTPVRVEARRAATSGQDFGGLFVGFSLFLVVAALLLMALLFRFGLEQRLPEVGVLVAIGLRSGFVSRIWLAEALGLAVVGGLFGALGGVGYARVMIHGLTTIWSGAVAGTPLALHLDPGTWLVGLVASVSVCVVSIWLTMRRQFARPPCALMSGEIEDEDIGKKVKQGPGTTGSPPRKGKYGWAVASLAAALGLVVAGAVSGEAANPGVFFGAGALSLLAGIAFVSTSFRRTEPAASALSESTTLTFGQLALRGLARRRSRSMATIIMLASGVFVVGSLGVFRLDSTRDAERRDSGTGGFRLIGESSLPIVVDLNTTAGLEQFGLGTNELAGASFVPFRVVEGDDASCLNLDRAQRPRLLGVRPESLADRGAFRFGAVTRGIDRGTAWLALKAWTETAGRITEIPAIGDAASIQWALGKKMGDTLELADESGRPFRIRLIGGVVNSILQGSLVVDETALARLYPGATGHRWFLVDAERDGEPQVTSALTRALQDVGLEVVPALRRMAELNAVQNTYLGTFQVLGGLGVLLGSAGLGVVVLRNVLERRKELGVLGAVGFRRDEISSLVLREHVALLGLGVGIGLFAAALAVFPTLWVARAEVPWGNAAAMVMLSTLTGGVTTWFATRISVRGTLSSSLRGE